MAHGLPALVANQYSVLASSATSFAQLFYWSLAQGLTLGQAAREARIGVNFSMQGELIDWAVPVVYARDPNLTLCERVESPAGSGTVPGAVRATSRRATTGRSVRVAVWDIDGVFPGLSDTLARMNAAQAVFGFELVDLSVPLDVWDLEERAEDGSPYLRAERLAGRCAGKTVELRCDVLACVTRHWLRDENWLNLYGWWPERTEPPVVIFSCAGFDELKAQGPVTDRVIANVAVTGLAGFLAGMDAHDRGRKDCPMHFNGDRDFAGARSAARALFRGTLNGQNTKARGSRKSAPKVRRSAAPTAPGPVTLGEARALALRSAPKRAPRRVAAAVATASPGSVAAERRRLELAQRQEARRRIQEYEATLRIMKQRGVRPSGARRARVAASSRARAALVAVPL